MSSGLRLAVLATPDPLGTGALGRAMTTELHARFFVWDAFVSGKRRVDVHPLVLSAGRYEEACRVAERAAALVARAADRAAVDPAERARYRFHDDVEALADASRGAGDLLTLARVDLLLSDTGALVACEVNADCPGGHNEVLALPHLARASGHRGGRDPSTVVGQLADELVRASGGRGSPRGVVALVYATGYAEDLQVCALVERLVVERGGRTVRVPPTAIRGRLAGSVEARGERVAALYRFYPIEYMAGQRNVAAIASAVRRGELRTVSSFASAHAQSKLAMARALVQAPGEAASVFPATFAVSEVAKETLARDRASWVVKRALSRVGDHVLVGAQMSDEDFAAALDDVAASEAEDSDVWIAQRFVPQASVATPWGPRWLTLGVYVMGGRACGVFARLAGDLLCSHDALVVPVFVEQAA